MPHTNLPRRPPSLDLISLATPVEEFDEKDPKYQSENTAAPQSSRGRSSRHHQQPRPSSSNSQFVPSLLTSSSSRSPSSCLPSQSHHSSAPFGRPPQAQGLARSVSNVTYPRPPRGPRLARILKPWIPMILYALTSLAFVVAFALYRTELFALLDELSLWLRSDEQYGQAVLFCLIFLTTIPPIPLYSTLIILSGYTFGPWMGALISYFAALAGALVVFVLSRTLFQESIGRWLNSCTGIKRVVRAIEKRPKLLFLIRLAPYPYNVMNCLLAASPTLTLHTYTVCTALSLFKVIIHTSVGASIHSFRDFHVEDSTSAEDEGNADWLARMWSILGISLCVLILVYLSMVARRAVDEELDDEPITAQNSEETEGFLSAASDIESGTPSSSSPMVEVPFRTAPLVPYQSSFSVESNTIPGTVQGRW